MTSIEWLIEQLRQLAHNDKHHLGMGDIRITQGMLDDFYEQAKEMNNAETQIPNDEIFKAALDYDNMTSYTTPIGHFQMGAFWYREQLKQKQMNWNPSDGAESAEELNEN
jgi:hypothetical protein